METLINLNKEQQEAVICTEGSLLILAGAGSGKTRVITERIAHLTDLGVPGYNILAITFTNKAAREMRERVEGLVGQNTDVWVSTFHSFCVRILRIYIDHIGYDSHFTIYDSDDSIRLIKKCIKELNINDKQFPAKSIMSSISSYKDELLSPEKAAQKFGSDYREQIIISVYESYQKKLSDSNSLDFDDIIFLTVKLFEKCPDVLAKYSSRFRYIMVDEYQDTNMPQFKLIKMLASHHKNLCVVGDDDQSIYGWRGANVQHILDFEKTFEGTKVIKLEQNYRSTQKILDAANGVIANNISRKSKILWTSNNPGDEITFFKGQTDIDEAEFVSSLIADSVKLGGLYRDNAILYRSNAQSRSFEDRLILKKIPYKIFGGVRFYERKEVKDLLAYLRIVNNPVDDISILRILNVPKRGIGDSTIDKITAFSLANDISFFEALSDYENIPSIGNKGKKVQEFVELLNNLINFAKDSNVFEVINKVIEVTGYVAELSAENNEEALGRIENINELITKTADFVRDDEGSLSSFLEDVALVADIDNYKEDDDAVVLMTLHSSKGLEFKNVFMVGFEDGIFPSYRSVTSGELKDLEEERRLCYVGITRARENLYISACESRLQYGQTVYNRVSRFYDEIPRQLLKTFELPDKKQKLSSNRFSGSTSATKEQGKNSLKNYFAKQKTISSTNNLEFNVGDKVSQVKYGIGLVTEIRQAGADFEVTVQFDGLTPKKFLSHLSNLKKA